MYHDKEKVLPAADALWPEILIALTSIDQRFFNGKNQPCHLCGGKDRARFIRKHDNQFHCNQCGDKSGINFYMQYAGIDFSQALNDVGDWLNLIPTDRRETIQREHEIICKFPDWYNFDMKHYLKLKKNSTVDLSSWQRVSGLNMLDILKHGDDALIPLLDENGKPVDFVMLDIDGNYQTTGGNKIIPSGFHSTFGDKVGKHRYIAVSPFTAAHASIFTQRQVICCYEPENIWEIGKKFDEPPVVIVTSVEETQEADIVKFSQLTFNKANNTVNRRLYQPGEIMKERGSK